MSSSIRIAKPDLDQLVSVLTSRYRLFGPVNVDGATMLREVRSADELVLDAMLDGPAKAAFFPQTETLLTFDGTASEAPLGRERPTAVLGVRPCDARGLLLLDKVFSTGKYRDSLWQRRHDDSLIIGLGCSAPLETCFCNSMSSGPFDSQGSDIMLTDIGDAFLAESHTDKGERFLKSAFKSQVQRPSQSDLDKSGQARSKALAAMAPEADFSGVKAALAKLWENPLWDEFALGCLSCGACAYLCPTCHCFDVQDETAPGTSRGRRIRIWDTCQSALFTKEASGHNPRSSAKERIRQRVMHKFSYFVDNFGEAACVGCGRCIRLCPADFDVRQALERVKAEDRRPGTEDRVTAQDVRHAG